MVGLQLISDADEGVCGALRDRVVACVQLVDHCGQRGRGCILGGGDAANVVYRLPKRVTALLKLLGVTADLRGGRAQRQQRVGRLVDARRQLSCPRGKLSGGGQRGVETGHQASGAGIDLLRAVGELAGTVGGLGDARTRGDDDREHLVDRLAGDPGGHRIKHLVDRTTPDGRRDVVVGVVVDRDQVGLGRLARHG